MPQGDQVVAIAQKNGKFTLRGVRVFGELPAGSNGYDFAVSEEWLKEAVAKGKKRAAKDGFEAPVNVFHNSTGKAINVGTFVPVSVEQIEYEGKKTPTILVDFHDVTAEAKASIERGELRYRSVEFNFATRELAAVALLPTQEPFFKYGLLGIAETIPAASGAAFSSAAIASYEARKTGGLCFAATMGAKRVALFEFAQGFEEKKAAGEEAEDDEKKKAGKGSEEKTDTGEEPEEAAAAGGEESEEEETEIETPGHAGESQALLQTVLAWVKRIGEKVLGAAAMNANAPAAPVEMGTQTTNHEATRQEDAMDEATKTKLAEFETKIKGFEATEALRAAGAAKAERLTAAKVKLRGVNLSTADEADLAEFAADQGALDRAVAILQRRGRSSGETFETVVGADGTQGGDPAEVAEYAAKGPDALAQARTLARKHAECTRRGMTSSLKNFLEANIGVKPNPVQD